MNDDDSDDEDIIINSYWRDVPDSGIIDRILPRIDGSKCIESEPERVSIKDNFLVERKNCHHEWSGVESDLLLYWVKRIKTEKYIPLSLFHAEMRLTVKRVEEIIKYGYYGQISLVQGVGGLGFVYDDENEKGEEVEDHGTELKNEQEIGEDIAIQCKEVAETRKAVKVEAVNASAVSTGSFHQQDNGKQKTVLEVIEKSSIVGKPPAIDSLCMTEFTDISDLVSPRRNEYYDSESSHQLYPSIENKVYNGILSDQSNFGYELEEGLENAVVDNKETLLVGDTTGLTIMPSSQWFGDRLSLDDMGDKIVGQERKTAASPFPFQSVDYVAFKKLRGWGIFGRF